MLHVGPWYHLFKDIGHLLDNYWPYIAGKTTVVFPLYVFFLITTIIYMDNYKII